MAAGFTASFASTFGAALTSLLCNEELVYDGASYGVVLPLSPFMLRASLTQTTLDLALSWFVIGIVVLGRLGLLAVEATGLRASLIESTLV